MLIYRHPQQIRKQIKQENSPQPISMVGAGRGGALIAFVESAKAGSASGR